MFASLQDFSTSSLQGEVALEMRQAVEEMEEDDINIYQISERKRWEQKCLIYRFNMAPCSFFFLISALIHTSSSIGMA